MRPFSLRRLISVALAVLLLPACGGSGDDAATTTVAAATTEPTATTGAPSTTMIPDAPETEVFEISFDGGVCTVDGPAQVPAGDYAFMLTDASDSGVVLVVGQLDERRTYEELAAFLRARRGVFLVHEWLRPLFPSFGPLPREPGENEAGWRVILEPGEHVIAAVDDVPVRWWMCSDLIVVDE
jgi:hypothetical protein